MAFRSTDQRHAMTILQKELREIDKDKSSGVSVRVMAESNLCRLQGCIQGDMIFAVSVTTTCDFPDIYKTCSFIEVH